MKGNFLMVETKDISSKLSDSQAKELNKKMFRKLTLSILMVATVMVYSNLVVKQPKNGDYTNILVMKLLRLYR